MSDHNVFADLDKHQELMDELGRGSDALFDAAKEVSKYKEDLQNHNLDETAHPNLTRRVAQLEAKDNENVDERIKEHNENESSHPKLIAMLRKEMANNEDVLKLIIQKISEHDKSALAHPDLRAAISKLQTQVGNVDLSDLTNRVEILEGHIIRIDEEIIDLQNVDAEFRAQFENLMAENRNLRDMIDKLQKDLDTLLNTDDEGNTSPINSELIEKLLQIIAKYETQSSDGTITYNPNGPDLSQFENDLPMFIKRSSSVEFCVWGAQPRIKDGETPEEGAHHITYDLTIKKGEGVLSKLQNIEAKEKVTLTIDDSMSAGDMMIIICNAVDRTTKEFTQAILVTSVAKNVNSDAITILGLPELVEPGMEYELIIRNVLDDSNKCEYWFDPKSTGIIFEPSTPVKAGTTIKMIVPSTLNYDSDYIVDLIVDDKINELTTKPVVIHTAPGLEGTKDNFTSTTPEIMVPGSMAYVKFSGVETPKGVKAKYRIENTSPDFLVISKTNDILAGENIKIVLASDAERGMTYPFKVYAYTNEYNALEFDQMITVNMLPNAGKVTTTLPATSQGGKTLHFTISGGEDPDNGIPITYTIENTGSGLAFTQTANISSDREVGVHLPKVSTDTTMSFKVYAVDSYGEKSALGREISIKILPIWKAYAPEISAPTTGSEVECEFEMRWSNFDMYPDMS